MKKPKFFVISAPTTLIFLSHPWLVKYYPVTDWSRGKISEWSSFCLANCLQSALSLAGKAQSHCEPLQERLDLSSVHDTYHDLGEGF